jgi:hypothetical protein
LIGKHKGNIIFVCFLAHHHFAELFKNIRKQREDCLNEASFAAPEYFKNVRNVSLCETNVIGLSFLSPLRCWFVFFSQVKKMNEINYF